MLISDLFYIALRNNENFASENTQKIGTIMRIRFRETTLHSDYSCVRRLDGGENRLALVEAQLRRVVDGVGVAIKVKALLVKRLGYELP